MASSRSRLSEFQGCRRLDNPEFDGVPAETRLERALAAGRLDLSHRPRRCRRTYRTRPGPSTRSWCHRARSNGRRNLSGSASAPTASPSDGGSLFASTPTGVAAFRLSDGAPLWNRQITTTPGQGVDIQTLPYDGRVYVASVPVNITKIYNGVPSATSSVGRQHGQDRLAFRYRGLEGHWGNPAVNSGGGGWYPPASTSGQAFVYWGVANPAPFVGTQQYPNGSSRPGANLYNDSMVALSATTGKLSLVPPGLPPRPLRP